LNRCVERFSLALRRLRGVFDAIAPAAGTRKAVATAGRGPGKVLGAALGPTAAIFGRLLSCRT